MLKINAHMHKIISFVCFISMVSASNLYADADNGKGIIIKKNNVKHDNQKLGSARNVPEQIQISETTLMQGNTAETKYIDIPVNKAAILKLPRPSRDVVVANPELMDVVVRTPQEIYLFAKKAGHTNAFIFDAAGKQIVNLEINVGLDIKELERVFNEQIPNSNIKVTSMADTIILSGNVKNASHAKIARDISARMVDSPEKVINNIGVTGQEQVMIKVKVAEMQRTILKQLGIDWNTAFQFGQFNGSFGLANSFAANGAPATGLVGNAVNTSNIISKSIGGLPSFANASAVTSYLGGLVNNRDRLIALIDGNREKITSIIETAAEDGNAPNGAQQTLISQLQSDITSASNRVGSLDTQILQIQNQLDNGTVIGEDGLEVRRRTAGFSAGNLAIDNLLKALERNSLIKTLAEPNLTALSGESAKFLAGGELPYITATTLGQAQVDFKPYGVGLAFTPVVLDNDRISLKVSTEISEIGDTVTALNSSYPGLNIRRAETTVEMPSGGTMAMAGLIRDDTRRSVDSTPGLKEVPVLGPLFRSNDFKNLQSELVVLVTPYLAKPAHESEFGLPTDGYANPSDMDMYVRGHLAAVYEDDKNEKDEGSLTDTIGNLFSGDKDADTTATNNNSDEYIVE